MCEFSPSQKGGGRKDDQGNKPCRGGMGWGGGERRKGGRNKGKNKTLSGNKQTKRVTRARRSPQRVTPCRVPWHRGTPLRRTAPPAARGAAAAAPAPGCRPRPRTAEPRRQDPAPRRCLPGKFGGAEIPPRGRGTLPAGWHSFGQRGAEAEKKNTGDTKIIIIKPPQFPKLHRSIRLLWKSSRGGKKKSQKPPSSSPPPRGTDGGAGSRCLPRAQDCALSRRRPPAALRRRAPAAGPGPSPSPAPRRAAPPAVLPPAAQLEFKGAVLAGPRLPPPPRAGWVCLFNQKFPAGAKRRCAEIRAPAEAQEERERSVGCV